MSVHFSYSTNSPEGRHSVGKSATHGSRLHLSTNGFSPLSLSRSVSQHWKMIPISRGRPPPLPSLYAAPPMFIFNRSLSIGDRVAVSVSICLSSILVGWSQPRRESTERETEREREGKREGLEGAREADRKGTRDPSLFQIGNADPQRTNFFHSYVSFFSGSRPLVIPRYPRWHADPA